MEKLCIGIDIAKLTFTATIKNGDKDKVKSFSNNAKDFKKFIVQVKQFQADKYHFCMESTGKYGDALALFLFKQGHLVSVVNPARINYFMKSQLARNKTDSMDPKFIRHYCELFSPSKWAPIPLAKQELQTLVKRRDGLNSMLLQEQNRLELVDDIIKKSIDDHISYLQNEIKDLEKRMDDHINADPSFKKNAELLQSIKGIGKQTTRKTIAFLSDVSKFENAKQMAAFVGLNPQHAQSGTSLDYCHISKTGDADLRKMFYMPALVAIQYEPSMKAFYDKLVGKGKPKKVAICAVMRKLVHIIYGVLKSQKSFDPQLIVAH